MDFQMIEQSPLTFNCHLPYIKNYPRFIKRMQKLNPRGLVGLVDSDNDMPMIEGLKADLPNTRIVGRVVVKDRDGEFHLKPKAKDDNREWIASPVDFMNRWGRLGRRGGTLYAENEPGTGYDPAKADEVGDVERLVKWTVQTAQMGMLNDTSLCLLNLGTGQPKIFNDEWDSIFDPILKMPPGTWDRHMIGLHEYKPRPGRILRLKALLKRCQTLKVQPPKLGITECGWDRDPNSTEDSKLRGYKVRGMNGLAYFNDLRELIEVDYRPFIDAGILLFVAVFCYGNSGGWDDMDVENDDGFWEALNEWKYVPGTVTPTPEPQPEPEKEPEKPVPVNPYAKIVALLRELANELEQLGVAEPVV